MPQGQSRINVKIKSKEESDVNGRGPKVSVEDLEKLLFVWQEATEITNNRIEIEIGEEVETADGLKYSAFSIRENNA